MGRWEISYEGTLGGRGWDLGRSLKFDLDLREWFSREGFSMDRWNGMECFEIFLEVLAWEKGWKYPMPQN